MIHTLLNLLYIPVCLFLILVVLLQTGKRADLAGAFGGGGSQTAFGTRGAATLLTRLTTIAAVLFMLTALTLSIMTSHRGGRRGSVLDEVAPGPPASAPAEAPAPTGEAPVTPEGPAGEPPTDATSSPADATSGEPGQP
jgi:preprotein translocase subunit SecG